MVEIASTRFYSISVDPARNRLYLTLTGRWNDPDEAPHYLDDLAAAIDSLSPGFTILTDARRFETPSPSAAAVHVQAQKMLIDAGLDRTAEVPAGGATAMMTAHHLSRDSGMTKGVFSSLEDAQAWLNRNRSVPR